MTKPVRQPASATRIIETLAHVPRLDSLGPIAARFIHSLRLIALHERARRDPVPELTARLGSVEIAAKALALSQAITATWPENIHVSRFCCPRLTHDEATIGTVIDCAVARNRIGFEQQLQGLVRPEREGRIWDAVFALVVAEMHAA